MQVLGGLVELGAGLGFRGSGVRVLGCRVWSVRVFGKHIRAQFVADSV